jgi:uncharacterized membrane protein YkvA (DUF1232 family)
MPTDPDLAATRRSALFAVLAWTAQLAYILFPFDLLPDFLPLVGWIDDLVALGGLIATTVWMARTLHELGVERLVTGAEPATLDQAAYEPLPDDVIRAL